MFRGRTAGEHFADEIHGHLADLKNSAKTLENTLNESQLDPNGFWRRTHYSTNSPKWRRLPFYLRGSQLRLNTKG